MAEYDEKDIASKIRNRSTVEYDVPREDDIIVDAIDVETEAPKVLSAEEQTALDEKNAQFLERVKGTKAKPLPSNRMDRRLNITRLCNEVGHNPAMTLIHISRNNWQELQLDKPVSAHEINSASQTLLGYMLPNFKPVDYVDPDEELKQIPVFVGRRELPAGHAPAISYDEAEGKYTDEKIGADGESVYGESLPCNDGAEGSEDTKVSE